LLPPGILIAYAKSRRFARTTRVLWDPGMATDNELIFHSDDAGATAQVTRHILQAWRSGLIDSASVLANGDAVELLARELAADAERPLRLAVHLNLSEGRSLSPPEAVPRLVSTDGSFACTFGRLIKTWSTGSPKARAELLFQIEAEWQLQIARVQELAGPRGVTALDGHQHFHMLPFLFPVAARLAERNGIPEIRVSREVFHFSPSAAENLSLGFAVNVIKHFVLRACATPAWRVLARHGLSAPDALVGVLFTGRMTEAVAAAGIRASRRRGKRRIEVLFHVGGASAGEAGRWSSAPNIGAFYLSPDRETEMAELAKLRARLLENG
jgi:chitin disaccharide deacetylase